MIRFLTALLVIVTTHAQAQNLSRLKSSSRPPEEAFRISFFIPRVNAEFDGTARIRATGQSGPVSSTSSFDAVGVNLGYHNLPYQRLGFITQLGLINLDSKDGSDTSDILRLEGSAAIAISDAFYFKAGLNYARFMSKEEFAVDPGFGLLFGAGFRISPNLSFDLTYSAMNFSTEVLVVDPQMGAIDADLDLVIKGLELGLVGTF